MEFKIGQVVYSKSGRDKGGAFIVLSVQGNYAIIADGEIRRLDKPKRKKLMHLQPTGFCDGEIEEILLNNRYINDAMLRKSLEPFKRRKQGGHDHG